MNEQKEVNKEENEIRFELSSRQLEFFLYKLKNNYKYEVEQKSTIQLEDIKSKLDLICQYRYEDLDDNMKNILLGLLDNIAFDITKKAAKLLN